jgi:hypothetical protein
MARISKIIKTDRVLSRRYVESRLRNHGFSKHANSVSDRRKYWAIWEVCTKGVFNVCGTKKFIKEVEDMVKLIMEKLKHEDFEIYHPKLNEDFYTVYQEYRNDLGVHLQTYEYEELDEILVEMTLIKHTLETPEVQELLDHIFNDVIYLYSSLFDEDYINLVAGVYKDIEDTWTKMSKRIKYYTPNIPFKITVRGKDFVFPTDTRKHFQDMRDVRTPVFKTKEKYVHERVWRHIFVDQVKINEDKKDLVRAEFDKLVSLPGFVKLKEATFPYYDILAKNTDKKNRFIQKRIKHAVKNADQKRMRNKNYKRSIKKKAAREANKIANDEFDRLVKKYQKADKYDPVRILEDCYNYKTKLKEEGKWPKNRISTLRPPPYSRPAIELAYHAMHVMINGGHPCIRAERILPKRKRLFNNDTDNPCNIHS